MIKYLLSPIISPLCLILAIIFIGLVVYCISGLFMAGLGEDNYTDDKYENYEWFLIGMIAKSETSSKEYKILQECRKEFRETYREEEK